MKNVIVKFREYYSEASSTEKGVIEYLLEHPEEVAEMGLRELAKATYVSSSTITRLCHKAGFSQYKDFQKSLVYENALRKETITGKNCEIAKDDSLEQLVNKIIYKSIVGLIAGGQEAFIKAKEGAEDDPELGKRNLQEHQLTDKDVMIGLAASGRTPYVIGALRYAREIGCRIVSISNNREAPISAEADLAIELFTGPEVLTGSTRLKAGTAEKMVLNMISTASMVGIGKVYENLMVDVRQSNEKLVIRSENIVMEAVGCSREEARKNLAETGGKTKLAITKLLLGCDVDTAEESLERAGGKVKVAVSKRQAY